LYGTGPTQSVTDDFFENRMKVLEQADQIRAGASFQGREVGLTEALSLAHDSISASYRVQAIREDIKAKVQQRASSVTTPPAKGSEGGSTSAPSGERPEKTRKEIEDASAIALREIFG
jgi:hypothetical protein